MKPSGFAFVAIIAVGILASCQLSDAQLGHVVKDVFSKLTSGGIGAAQSIVPESAPVCGAPILSSDQSAVSPEIIFISTRLTRETSISDQPSSSSYNNNNNNNNNNNRRPTRPRNSENLARSAIGDSVLNEFRFNVDNVSLEALQDQGFNPKAPVTFLIHGFTSGYPLQAWMTGIVDIYTINERKNPNKQLASQNLFVVNWHYGARSINYLRATANVPIVAAYLVKFIDRLVDELGVDSRQIQLVGHSLGAHLSGFTAKNTKSRIGRIYGLDPAGPCFGTLFGKLGFLSFYPTNQRLSPTDAEEVITVVTNTELLGLDADLGQYSVFVEGGKSQPGCTGGAPGIIKSLETFTLEGGDAGAIACSHSRAPLLMAYRHHQGTGKNDDNDCQMVAYECNDWDSYKHGHCGYCDESNSQCLLVGLNWQYPNKTLTSNSNINSGYDKDNSGYNQGNQNSGYNQGNSGYGQGSSGYGQGDSGYGQSNSNYGQGNSGHSNQGHSQSNSGYGQSNSGHNNQGHSQGNSGYGQSNSGYGQSGQNNHGYGQSNSGHGQSNSGYGQSGQNNHGYGQSNSGHGQSNSGFGQSGNSGYGQSGHNNHGPSSSGYSQGGHTNQGHDQQSNYGQSSSNSGHDNHGYSQGNQNHGHNQGNQNHGYGSNGGYQGATHTMTKRDLFSSVMKPAASILKPSGGSNIVSSIAKPMLGGHTPHIPSILSGGKNNDRDSTMDSTYDTTSNQNVHKNQNHIQNNQNNQDNFEKFGNQGNNHKQTGSHQNNNNNYQGGKAPDGNEPNVEGALKKPDGKKRMFLRTGDTQPYCNYQYQLIMDLHSPFDTPLKPQLSLVLQDEQTEDVERSDGTVDSVRTDKNSLSTEEFGYKVNDLRYTLLLTTANKVRRITKGTMLSLDGVDPNKIKQLRINYMSNIDFKKRQEYSSTLCVVKTTNDKPKEQTGLNPLAFNTAKDKPKQNRVYFGECNSN